MADRSIPPDSVIVAAAEEAGLCFPRCWNLDEAISPAVLQENRDWVEAAPTPEQRRDRQSVVDHTISRARDQLGKLRRFAELIIARSAQS